MDFKKDMENKQKTKNENWETLISRYIKSKKSRGQKNTTHCANYSSVTCLRCDKCWGGIYKTPEESNEK